MARPWVHFVAVGEVPASGTALALDIHPRNRRVTLAPLPMGLGSPEVGQQVVYRVFYEGAATESAAVWLAGPEATALLAAVDEGFQASMTWSGDLVGSWTEAAWAAAEALAEGVDQALDAG